MENEVDIVRQAKQELKRTFKLESKTSAELSRLTRELEIKRQTGALTNSERNLIREVDDLWENIARLNQTKKAPPKAKTVEEIMPPLIVPNISSQEADKIIAHFNKQFQEKVMNKINPKASFVPESTPPADSGRDRAEDKNEGRNLQDYLMAVRNERPKVPFADGDSHIDLSKLSRQVNKNV